MRIEWLVEVLRDIGDYAKKNDLLWLVPLIDDAYAAAQKELVLTPHEPVAFRGGTKTAGESSHDVLRDETRTVVVFPSGGRNSFSEDFGRSRLVKPEQPPRP